jgi:hypothetical protein
MAQTKNLVLYQGDTFELIFQLKEKGTGLPVNLTGCVPSSEIRTSAASPTVEETFTAELVSPATDGKVRLSLTAAETTDLSPGASLVWDVQLLWPDGVVKTYLAGSLNVLPEVTRA